MTMAIGLLDNLTLGGISLAFEQAYTDNPGDWFYKVTVDGHDYFVEQNETGGYTVMFPYEH